MTPLHTPRRLAVFQMHHTDADERLLEHNAVRRLRMSGLFDDVVLAVADVPENRVLEDFADAWGVELFRGSESDLARRIGAAAELFSADTVARGLVWWFFQDLDLVHALVERLEAGEADYVTLPRDFDVRFGADVFRPRFLHKVQALMADEPELGPRHRMNPWSLAEARPDSFALEEHGDVPTYDRARFDAVRAEMSQLWPERWDGAATPLFPYRLAAERMPAGGRVLDVACGLGAGTALLAERGSALGLDLSEEAVEAALDKHGQHAEFRVADVLDVELPDASFDAVCSVHTMEHLADDERFLARVSQWLRPGGELVLEVPLLMRGPFRGIDTPLSPGHEREYTAAGLIELVGRHLDIVLTLGVSRGVHVPLEHARNAAVIVARKPAASGAQA